METTEKAPEQAQQEWPIATHRVERWFGTQKITHCVSDTELDFRHWLEGPNGERSEAHVGYNFIPHLRIGGQHYIALTGYWEGDFEIEKPLQVI